MNKQCVGKKGKVEDDETGGIRSVCVLNIKVEEEMKIKSYLLGWSC